MKRIKTQEREPLVELGRGGSRKDTMALTGGRISEALVGKGLLLGDRRKEAERPVGTATDTFGHTRCRGPQKSAHRPECSTSRRRDEGL